MNNYEVLQGMLSQLVLLVPLATGLTEVAKRAGLPARFLPITSVLLGVACGLLVLDLSVAAGIAGVIAGLAGTGLWEVGQKAVGTQPQE